MPFRGCRSAWAWGQLGEGGKAATGLGVWAGGVGFLPGDELEGAAGGPASQEVSQGGDLPGILSTDLHTQSGSSSQNGGLSVVIPGYLLEKHQLALVTWP